MFYFWGRNKNTADGYAAVVLDHIELRLPQLASLYLRSWFLVDVFLAMPWADVLRKRLELSSWESSNDSRERLLIALRCDFDRASVIRIGLLIFGIRLLSKCFLLNDKKDIF